MDMHELKTQHQELYAAAVAEGVATERDRVTAHITLGTKFKQMPIALAAIKDGSGLTPELSTQYIEGAANALDQRARQMDSDAAGAILDGAVVPAADGAQDLGDLVADRLCGKQAAL